MSKSAAECVRNAHIKGWFYRMHLLSFACPRWLAFVFIYLFILFQLNRDAILMRKIKLFSLTEEKKKKKKKEISQKTDYTSNENNANNNRSTYNN